MTYLDPQFRNDQDDIDAILGQLDEHYRDENGEPENGEGNSESTDDGEEQQRSGDTEEDTQGEGTPEGTDGVQQEGESDHGQPQGTPQSISVDGRTFDVNEIKRYAEFEKFLSDHPDVAARVVEAARGSTGTPAPISTERPSTAPTPPPELDLEDPATKFLWEQHVATQQQLRDLQQAQYQYKLSQAESQLATAQTHIKDKFKLSDEDVTILAQKTANLNIIPGIMSRVGNPIAAFEQALEYTYWATEEFRTREIDSKVTQKTSTVKADRERQNKLGKLSNTSGGGRPPARQNKDPKQMSEDERRDAMIVEISEALYSGN